MMDTSILLATVGLILRLATAVAALSPQLFSCQVQKPTGVSPIEGCPSDTIFVSQNRADPFAQFHSIQDAIRALPDSGGFVILVGAGEYHETINITRRGPLTLVGQIAAEASLPSTRTANISESNLVQIWDNKFVVPGMDDADSAVLSVAPSRDAALIGAGPTGAPLQPLSGNADFKAYNIDFQNRAANFSISQALVTDISYANASFYGCSFASYQDTWYTGRNASTYVVDSVIFGQTDYLFGFGTAWFEDVVLANRACGGGIVAWKGTNQTDAPGNRYGAYVSNSRIARSPDANTTVVTADRCFLGRPWNDLATTVFLRTNMDDSIRPEGWTPFNSDRPTIMNTTFYAEYKSSGAGGDTSHRIPLEHLLSDEEARKFTIPLVFGERQPSWIDFSYIHGDTPATLSNCNS